MKLILTYLLMAGLAVGLGILAGAGWSWFEFSNTPETYFANQWKQSDGQPGFKLIGQARVEMTIEPGNQYSHEFLVENTGSAELVIRAAEKSEQVQSDLTGELVVAPGATSPIGVQLNVEADSPVFRGFVVLQTNDPDPERQSIRLEILDPSKVDTEGN